MFEQFNTFPRSYCLHSTVKWPECEEGTAEMYIIVVIFIIVVNKTM